MKKYHSGTAMIGRKCMCCRTRIALSASDSDLFSASNGSIVSHMEAYLAFARKVDSQSPEPLFYR